jgi:hypothetical protein
VNGVAGILIIASWVAMWILWQLLVVRALLTKAHGGA